MFQWLLTAGAAIVALASLVRARRLSRRFEKLSESYWELRYAHGQLSARLDRLENVADKDAARSPAQGVRLPDGTANFVPLSSLKRP